MQIKDFHLYVTYPFPKNFRPVRYLSNDPMALPVHYTGELDFCQAHGYWVYTGPLPPDWTRLFEHENCWGRFHIHDIFATEITNICQHPWYYSGVVRYADLTYTYISDELIFQDTKDRMLVKAYFASKRDQPDALFNR